MIDLIGIGLRFGDRPLFDGLSFRLGDRDRVALVGPNGSGKTTLLRVMCGLLEPDTGQVSRRKGEEAGYLPQEGVVHRGRTVVEEARSAFADLLDLRAEAGRIEAAMERGEADERMVARHHDLEEIFRHRGGFGIEGRVAAVLDGLGFDRAEWGKDAATLSGGWQMRLALAKLLIRQPDTLLLDEPSNHLDLEASNWLEEYLLTYPGAFLLVSHDRHFLDHVVTHVAELRLARVRIWTGNYTKYLEESARETERLEEQKRRQDEEIERLERFIDRFRYKATKARQVQSRIKMLEKIDRIELPAQGAAVRFAFPEPPRSGRIVAELRGIRKSYGSRTVLSGADLRIERGDRVALVGPNGAGKSTLMRVLAGEEEFEGERRIGHNVSLAFFAQDQGDVLDPGQTVLDAVSAVAPFDVLPRIRDLLGSFLFRGDDVFKPVRVLSGGEKMRVALARMLLEPHNLLLLDEPTNHLDLASKEILLEALLAYAGAIVLVSHDRYVLDRLATSVAEVGGGTVSVYPGGYEGWLERKTGRSPFAAIPATPAPPPEAVPAEAPPEADSGRPRGDTRLAAKEARRAERETGKRRQALERRIEEMEAERRELEARMGTPGFFAGPGAREAVLRYESLGREIEGLYAEWGRLV